MMRIITPAITETAVAASASKEKMKGAAMRRIAARYSITPWTAAGMGPCRNTAGTLSEEHLGRLEELGVEQLRLGQRLVERDALDLRPPERDHGAEVPARRGVDRRHAEPGPEDPVVRERAAAALDVPEDRHARLVARALLDLALQSHRDAAETL